MIEVERVDHVGIHVADAEHSTKLAAAVLDGVLRHFVDEYALSLIHI